MIQLLIGCLALIAPSTSFVEDCTDCTFEPRGSKLCSPHRKEVTRGLKLAAGGLKEETAAKRIEALEQAAALNDSHANAPSPKVAELLGEGLEDSSWGVRRRALELLLDGQDPTEAVKALTEAAGAIEDELNGLRKELVWFAGASRKEQQKSGAKFDPSRYMTVPRLLADQLRALGKLPDDRSVKVLTGFLKSSPGEAPGGCYAAACEALIELGSRPALEAVAKFLPKLEASAGVQPEREGLFTLAMALAEQLVYVSDEDLEGVLVALAAKVEAAGVEGAPDPLASASVWAEWLPRFAKEQPAKLGKLQTVVHAELPPWEDAKATPGEPTDGD